LRFSDLSELRTFIMRLLLGTLERFPASLYSASRLVALLKSLVGQWPGEGR
jgi:hypothetical protein